MAVATKRQAGRALYEDAAEVMAEECGWRSESRCMTLFLLNPNTCAANLNRSYTCQKIGPRGVARALH